VQYVVAIVIMEPNWLGYERLAPVLLAVVAVVGYALVAKVVVSCRYLSLVVVGW